MRPVLLISPLVMVVSISYGQQDTLPIVEIKDQKPSVEAGFRIWKLDSVRPAYRFGNLAEVLLGETPAFFKSYGSNSLALPSLRGTGASHTQVFWNGLAVNSPVLGQFDFSLAPALLGQSLELLMGSAALQWGSGALGGAISISTQPLYGNNRFSGQLGVMGGSWGLWGVHLLTVRNREKRFSRNYLQFRRAQNDFPYLDSDKSPRRADAEYIQLAYNMDRAFRICSKNLIFSLWGNALTRQIQQPITTGEGQNERLKDAAIRTSLSYGSIQQGMVVGYFYQSATYENRTAQIKDPLEIHSLRFCSHRISRISLRSSLKTNFQALYDRATLEQLRFSAFAAWQYNHNKLETSFSLRPEYVSNGKLVFMPALGVQFTPHPRLTLLSNFSHTYRQLSLNELYWGRGLKPENALSAEAGFNFLGGQFAAEATFFALRVQDWIVWRPSVPVWRPENTGLVFSRGAEFKLSFASKRSFPASVPAFGSQIVYCFTKATSKGKQVIFTPEHQLKARSQIKYKKWAVGGHLQWISRRYIQSDNSAYLPGYALLGASLSRKSAKYLLECKINNLNNFNYQVIPFYAMPKRNFEVSLLIGAINN